MASNLDVQQQGTRRAGGPVHVRRTSGNLPQPATASAGVGGSQVLRIDSAHESAGIGRFPEKLSREAFYAMAYPVMVLSRRLEERLLELFRKGYVKGPVTSSAGNEGTAVGMSMPLRPGRDVVSLLHRDFAAHLILGSTPYQLACQYLGNAESPTHARYHPPQLPPP